MITYFKHTDGSAFKTLSGNDLIDYSGMINVVGNKAYTGALLTDESKPLTSSETFLSNVYLKKIDYNYNKINNSVSDAIKEVKIYPRTILTSSLLNETLDTLNENNLRLYSAGIRYDTNYFNKSHRLKPDLPVIHALSAVGSSLVPTKRVTSSIVFRPERDGLGTILNPSTDKNALFISDSTKFKFLNLTDSIDGSVNSLEEVTFGSGLNAANGLDFYFDLHYDKYTKTMYHVERDSRKYNIFRYDPDLPTNTMILLDSVELSKLSNIIIGRGKTAFGKRYRTCLAIDRDIIYIEVYGVREAELLRRFSLEDLGFDEILYIAQRFEDDALAIYGIKNGNAYITTYDIPEMLVDAPPVFSGIYQGEANPTYIEFCEFDSDVLFIREYVQQTNGVRWLKQLQFVSISAPEFPVATFSRKTVPYTGELFIINELDCLIDQCDEVILNRASQSFLMEMQFSASSKINTILLTNTYIQTDNYPLLTGISPFNLTQTYKPYVNTNSSIGLVINNILRTLITDVINIYTYYNEKFDTNRLGEILSISPTINNKINVADFSIYGNESINSRTINRAINTINELQLKLARKI